MPVNFKGVANMKKIILFITGLLFISSISFAGTWCQWSGSEGENCKTTDLRYIKIGPKGDHPVTIAPQNLNPMGWYELTITEPDIGADEIKDAEVWSFVDNAISLTWTVRDMTQAEIDTRDAEAMDPTMFYLLRGLIANGTFTLEQASSWFPQESIDAYQARSRLED